MRFNWQFIFLFAAGIFLKGILHAQQTDIKMRASVTLHASRTKLFPGECAVLNYALNINKQNNVPLRFLSLQEQIIDHLKFLQPEQTLNVNSNVNDIKPYTIIQGKDTIYTYALFEGAVCPVKEGILNIPSLDLNLQTFTVNNGDTTNSLVTLKSKAVTITTIPFPIKYPEALMAKNHIPVTGDFKVKEPLQDVTRAIGDPFEYTMIIQGNGLSKGLYPQVKPSDAYTIEFIDERNADYLWKDSVGASSIFRYLITPRQAGIINMNEVFFPIEYFNHVTRKIAKLKFNHTITIDGISDNKRKLNILPSDTIETTFILLDLSLSMNAQDYIPTRLEYVKNEIKKLLSKKYPAELIFFSSATRHLLSRTESPLSPEIVNSTLMKKRGTAIGDAIWHTTRYILSSNRKYTRKIIIIGDGDNTSGSLSPTMAATFAKKDGFKIYTIGIGSEGGVSIDGHRYNNTFTDKYLKAIAEITQGKYFHLNPGDSLEDILKLIR